MRHCYQRPGHQANHFCIQGNWDPCTIQVSLLKICHPSENIWWHQLSLLSRWQQPQLVHFIFIRKWDIWQSEMSLIPIIELLQHNKEAVKIPSEIAKINLLCLNRVVLSVCKAGIRDIQDMIKSRRTYPNYVLAKIKSFTRLRHWLEERGCCH